MSIWGRVNNGFNSTLVRLKVIDIDITCQVRAEFQFHIGSIKSESD